MAGHGVIANKRQNFDLWQSGVFGNKLRAWRSLDEWMSSTSGYVEELFALRQLDHGGGRCAYLLTPHALIYQWRLWVSLGASPNSLMVNEMAPDHRLVLNGEFLCDVLPDGRWGHLHFSRLKKPMRISLREAPEEASGLAARLLLNSVMTTGSWEDFEEITRSYQGHVIEFSVYDHCLGDVPSRNTLIWEIRRY
jgi:hypothetical protein